MTTTADPPRRPLRRDPQSAQPLLAAGAVAALSAAVLGLGVLTTLTLIGWIAAPHASLGQGLPSVFRTAVQAWLVAHHAGFSLAHGGSIDMLPLGLVILPGALLIRGGAGVARAVAAYRLRHAGQVALGLAVPYAVIAGLLALVGRSATIRPSLWQALVSGFLVALVAGGLGAARAVAPSRGLRGFMRLLPERPRSLVVAALGAMAVLVGAGAVLTCASIAVHFGGIVGLTHKLSPGVVGGLLLLLLQLIFLPNAVLWGVAYVVGPGFSVGVGTVVAPTGVVLGSLPTFPMLAALPRAGHSPVLSLATLVVPFVAGGCAGYLLVRAAPTPMLEAAPVWGFASGAITGASVGMLTAFSGGPLGGGRLTSVGPSAWQVAVATSLEVGVAAAVTAWLANWLLLRRHDHAEAAAEADAWNRDDIVDESDDRHGHRIYLDPFADDPP